MDELPLQLFDILQRRLKHMVWPGGWRVNGLSFVQHENLSVVNRTASEAQSHSYRETTLVSAALIQQLLYMAVM